jgi:hypothetical protein
MKIPGDGFGNMGLRVVRLGVFGAALLLLAASCGKKAPPMAPQPRPLAAVTDLKGSLDQGHIRLTWTHSPDNRYAKAYVVLRAQRELFQPECNDCPKVFQKVGTIPLSGSRRSEKHSLDFSQRLAAGFRYTFSVRPIHSSGAQGPDSNPVVMELPAGTAAE